MFVRRDTGTRQQNEAGGVGEWWPGTNGFGQTNYQIIAVCPLRDGCTWWSKVASFLHISAEKGLEMAWREEPWPGFLCRLLDRDSRGPATLALRFKGGMIISSTHCHRLLEPEVLTL
jgi:hypothetical protein